MPQGSRSPAEEVAFTHMLKNANLLYLGTLVLILLDLSYISRFWTQFEAWLSMQAPTVNGLAAATLEEKRYAIVPVHGANATMGEGLVAMWASKTPKAAYEVLASPDVTVTNQKDKETQLDKLGKIDEEVRKELDESAQPSDESAQPSETRTETDAFAAHEGAPAGRTEEEEATGTQSAAALGGAAHDMMQSVTATVGLLSQRVNFLQREKADDKPDEKPDAALAA